MKIITRLSLQRLRPLFKYLPNRGVTRSNDLKTDPQEMRDFASDQVNSDRKQKLFKKLQALQVQLSDSLRLEN